MRVQRGLAAAWHRAKQRQALGSRRFAGSSRVTVFRLFAGQLAAATQVWCLRRVFHLTGLGVALLVLGCEAGIIVLPDLGTQVEQTIQQQIDYEDDILCQKFGFAPGTQGLAGCKLDLADLRRRHEQLRAAYEFP
jgi:hypothetical protein